MMSVGFEASGDLQSASEERDEGRGRGQGENAPGQPALKDSRCGSQDRITGSAHDPPTLTVP